MHWHGCPQSSTRWSWHRTTPQQVRSMVHSNGESKWVLEHGLPFWIRLTRNQVVKQARKKPQSQLFLDYWLHHFAPLRCLLGLRDDGDEQIRRQYPGAWAKLDAKVPHVDNLLTDHLDRHHGCPRLLGCKLLERLHDKELHIHQDLPVYFVGSALHLHVYQLD